MISVSCTASRTSAFKALWMKLFMPVIEATLNLITSQVNPLLHASASSGWQACRRSESMYPRASAIAFTDVGERAITHLRNTFVCDPPTDVYLSEPSGGQRPPLRRERRSFAASTSSYAARRLESRGSQSFREHEPLGAYLATQVMRARWINQRPAAIFDVCPHLRRRDLENVRQFVPKEDFSSAPSRLLTSPN